jgi:hypothetical protein
MEINSTGFTARELVPNRTNVEQELTQRALEKEETVQQNRKPLEAKPVEQTGAEKQGRIDIYV